MAHPKTPAHSGPSCPSAFTRLARWTAQTAGKSGTFVTALLVIAGWAITGPLFRYSDTWQLVINTGTTIVTFLMVFLIQATQNRDSAAIHVKLDEIIRAMKGARNSLLDLDSLSDDELDRLKIHFAQLAEQAKHGRRPRAKEATTQPAMEKGRAHYP
ncbi:MAG TPA: low affinity iron permease family protein [Opitutaceae bacterium]|nr:low affinity iron permease family protein [Opitutaceae bacterium]